MKVDIYGRTFLNKKKGSAISEFVCSYYDTDIADATFKITDCNHTINLDFTFADKKAKADQLHKLNTLLAQLESFKKQLFERKA